MDLTSPDDESESSQMIPHGLLPSFLADAFQQLYEEDGLAVFGKGLGSFLLLASFVRFYADTVDGYVSIKDAGDETESPKLTKVCPRPPLVLVLGLREGERQALHSILQSWGSPPASMPTMITNEAGQSSDRTMLYEQGGVFCITSRIIIVDLLSNILAANAIDGILVHHADQVTEQSTEAFIIRIFQSQKKPYGSGFVKAFCESPEALLSGFAKVDKVLKALHVRRMYLFPRFTHGIREELEKRPPAVTELHQSLSAKQKDMQAAVAAAVKACIRQLKSATKLLDWNEADLSVENCVTTNFDRAISRQLEQDWHRLTPSTKQLVQDLRTLRTLFQSLIQFDCVSFWKLLNNIKTTSAASRYPSLWLLEPAADMLFRAAKGRVYEIVRSKPSKKEANPPARLETMLEENPKWILLKKVLTEIREAHEQTEEKAEGPTTVLVVVKDERTLESIKSYLRDGRKRTLMLRWYRYLEHYNDRSRSIINSKEGVAGISEESRLLLEEEGRIGRILFNKQEAPSSPNKRRLNQVPAHLRKRRRIAEEKGRGKQDLDDLEREGVLDDALEDAEHEEVETNRVANKLEDTRREDHEQDESMFQVTHPTELRIVLQTYGSMEGDQGLFLLQDMEPQYVVYYDVELSFVRSVEIYAALCEKEDPIGIYFLIYEASAEEKAFMKALEREQSAFERLILHKKKMPPPVLQSMETQEMQQALVQGSANSTYMDGALPLAFDSRKGQGKANRSKERRDIAVDVREFRSALPSILHQGGMRLAPVTLTVGDFVLSNVHCVERKSISDLFQSFGSGRLYTQAESMCRYYKAPILLIEFDPAKSFCLQSSSEVGVEIRKDSIGSKLSVLAMHFPKLRLLWSRGPHETLKIFRDLKVNHEEVDVEMAMEVGRNESMEALLQPSSKKHGSDEEEEDEINEVAREMLLRLPGVGVHAARKIMEEVNSIAELASMSRPDLRRVAGPIVGQKLFSFFQQNLGAT
jgi:DNA excision repair protein ERCC-4